MRSQEVRRKKRRQKTEDRSNRSYTTHTTHKSHHYPLPTTTTTHYPLRCPMTRLLELRRRLARLRRRRQRIRVEHRLQRAAAGRALGGGRHVPGRLALRVERHPAGHFGGAGRGARRVGLRPLVGPLVGKTRNRSRHGPAGRASGTHRQRLDRRRAVRVAGGRRLGLAATRTGGRRRRGPEQPAAERDARALARRIGPPSAAAAGHGRRLGRRRLSLPGARR